MELKGKSLGQVKDILNEEVLRITSPLLEYIEEYAKNNPKEKDTILALKNAYYHMSDGVIRSIKHFGN